MQDSIIFNTPLILIGVVIIALLTLFEHRTKSTGYFLPLVASVLSVLLVLYAIILGATLNEVSIILMILLIINIFGYRAV